MRLSSSQAYLTLSLFLGAASQSTMSDSLDVLDSVDAFEPTQVQGQTQLQQTDVEQEPSSQSQPWLKYWAILVPMHSHNPIIKCPHDKKEWSIGRRPDKDTYINEKRISGQHCKLERGEIGTDIVWLWDMGSSNGTFVNTHPVPKNCRRMLVHGDEISLGTSAISGGVDIRWIYRCVSKVSQAVPVGGVFDEYQMLENLGTGSFAEVKKAIHIESGVIVAVKIVKKHKFTANPHMLNQFMSEIDILKEMRHPYICSYINHYDDPMHIYIVLEYVDGGDMLAYINHYSSMNDGELESSSIPEGHTAELTLMMCQALEFIHGNNVAHRDLKPENLLLTKPDNQGKRKVKIADFGLAKVFDSQTFLSSLVGTPQYIAPEVCMQSKTAPGYDYLVDSWSVGIIVYTMLTKMLPFDDDPGVNMMQQIQDRYWVNYNSDILVELGISSVAIDFVSRLLDRDPTSRMTMTEALNHDFLRGRNLSQASAASQRHLETHTSSFSSMSVDTAFGVSTDIHTPIRQQVAEEDFSQPLRELRLNTPRADQSTIRPAIAAEDSHNDREPQSAWYLPDMKNADVKADASFVPDSDPQSAFWIPSLAAAAAVVDVAPATAATHEQVISPSTAGTPGIKRKLTAIVSGAPAAEFSSGELSPPPSPRKAAAVPAETMGETSEAGVASAPDARGPRRARISNEAATPVRVSPRLNAGVKKPKTEVPSPSSRTTRSKP